jgi:hypothetical protein
MSKYPDMKITGIPPTLCKKRGFLIKKRRKRGIPFLSEKN